MFTIVDLLLFLLPPLLSASLLAAAHWFPWNNGASDLSRVEAYTVGASVLIFVPVAAMIVCHLLGIERSTLGWAGLLMVNAIASGLTVKFAYWVDSHRAIGGTNG